MRSPMATAEVRVHIKIINLTMKSHNFDDTDVIRVFDFLAHFVIETDKLNISEGQAFIELPTLLEEP